MSIINKTYGIGWDIDGIMTDTEKNVIKCMRILVSTYFKDIDIESVVSMIDNDKYLFSDKFKNLPPEVLELIDDKLFSNRAYYDFIFVRSPLIEGLKDAMYRASNFTHPIHVITSRGTEVDEMTKFNPYGYSVEDLIIKFLTDNKLPYNKLVMTNDKLGYCLENNIKLMFEDCPHHIEALTNNGIKVAMREYGYNKHLEHPNIVAKFRSYYDFDVRDIKVL